MGAVQVLQPRRSATVVAPTLLAAVVVMVGGLALGIGTQVLQGVLPGSWGVIANSGTAWALGAFAVGALLPSDRAAAIGGAAAMVLASVSYHAAVDWFEGSSSNGRSALIWSIAARGRVGVRPRRPLVPHPARAPLAGAGPGGRRAPRRACTSSGTSASPTSGPPASSNWSWAAC